MAATCKIYTRLFLLLIAAVATIGGSSLFKLQPNHNKMMQALKSEKEMEEVPFEVPDKSVAVSNAVERSKPGGKRVVLNCVRTGPDCVHNCRGLQQGYYQMCHTCRYYQYCSGGPNGLRMPCSTGLVWDAKSASCRYPINVDTCLNCLPAATTYSFYVDLRSNYLGIGDDRYFKWASKPAPFPENDYSCTRQGTLMLTRPACAKSLRIYTTFHADHVAGYGFHLTNIMFADGWGANDGTGAQFAGQEIHSYGRTIYAFDVSPDGHTRLLNKADVTHDVIITVGDYVSVTNLGENRVTRSKIPSPYTLETAYLGINQIANMPAKAGVGTCDVWLSYIC